jgi:hypothetical protein
MTVTKGIKEIRELLDVLSEKKTDKDRLFVLFKIKVLVECIEEPLKERSYKKQAAYDKKTQIIKKALKQFLAALDKIYDKHEELGDTGAREQMDRAIHLSFVHSRKGYSLPQTFGMFSDEANALVRAALAEFLTHPEVLAASRALKSPEDRFVAFQDGDVKTRKGSTFCEYFGVSNKPRMA